MIDLLISPDAVQAVLNGVSESGNLTQIEVVKLLHLSADFLEVAVYVFSFSKELLILLVSNVLGLDVLPAFDLIHGSDDAEEFVLVKVRFCQGSATLAEGSV